MQYINWVSEVLKVVKSLQYIIYEDMSCQRSLDLCCRDWETVIKLCVLIAKLLYLMMFPEIYVILPYMWHCCI